MVTLTLGLRTRGSWLVGLRVENRWAEPEMLHFPTVSHVSQLIIEFLRVKAFHTVRFTAGTGIERENLMI